MKKVFIIISLLAVSGCAYFYYFPFSVLSLNAEINFYKHGVRHKPTQSFDLLEQAYCKTEECQCTLYIHGFADNYQTWTEAMTDPTQKDSGQNFYAVQLPHFAPDADSIFSDNDFAVENIARLLGKEVIPKCESWIVVGNSFGGWIAGHLAHQLGPNKIKALMLVDSAGLDLDYSEVIEIYRKPNLEGVDKLALQAYASDSVIPRFIAKALVRQWESMPLVKVLKAQTKEGFLDQELLELKIPVMVLWGDKDDFLPIQAQKLFLDRLSQAQAYTAQNCGHMPQKECYPQFKEAYEALLSKIKP